MPSVPEIRIRRCNERGVRAEGRFVLYWMIANRRIGWNFSLQRAVELARELNRPLVILEALRAGYPWASDRMHRFVMQGMADNQQALRDRPVTYYPYVEPKPDAGAGLLKSLADQACVIVTDDFPCFFLPRMVSAAARKVRVLLEAVDSNGLLPLRAADREFPSAYTFRRFLQKNLRPHLNQLPLENPLARAKLPVLEALPEEIVRRWPAATKETLSATAAVLSRLPIDHTAGPAAFDGGSQAAHKTLQTFLKQRLPRYAEDRNQPDEEAASGLSPYLHFGHISAHQVFAELSLWEEWSPDQIARTTTGQKEGWWNMSPDAESFLDELITWRELGYNFCSRRDDYDQYSSLPDWAKQTLEQHANDPREFTYSLDEFAQSRTHDELWNAAQTQLRTEGRMHNYLRMLWGKKILEWTESPQQALEVMIELNNRYAVDGRNSNSYSGIFWVLGRFDRAWGPERPIFGKIRYMSSDNTRRKLELKRYLERYGADHAAE